MTVFARGARVVILDHPKNGGLGGRVALVVEASHVDAPEAAVVSLDDTPGVVALVPNDPAVLAPFEDRPCLSLDPRCCMLAPCEACLTLLREHMSAALKQGKLTNEQGASFVTRWNQLRGDVRDRMAETLRQAREWHAAHPPVEAIVTPPPEEPPTELMTRPPAEVWTGLPPDPVVEAEASDALEGRVVLEGSGHPVEPVSPQDVPSVGVEKDVEKDRVTRRRKRSKKGPSSASAPKTRTERDPEPEEGAASSASGTASGEAVIDIPVERRSEP